MTRLRSAYDPAARSITLELLVADPLPAGTRLALTSIVQLTPTPGSGAVLTRPAFKNIKKKLDYAEYGGAPLLGINGVSVICHGRSNAKAIRNAIAVARDYCRGDVSRRIEEQLAFEG